VNKPKSSLKSTTYASPVPYKDAVQIIGSEDELRRSAGRPSRISNWKKRGVPAGIVLPVLLLRFLAVEQREGKSSAQAAVAPFLPEPGSDRLAKLPQGYRERYETRLREITARVQREADEFLKLLEAEYRTERSKRRDKRK
jgi:hypothetical protein